jgi:hypothetical protein
MVPSSSRYAAGPDRADHLAVAVFQGSQAIATVPPGIIVIADADQCGLEEMNDRRKNFLPRQAA